MTQAKPANVGRSVRLSFLSTLAAGALQFAALAILARLLLPRDYGTYALALAATSLSVTFVANAIERAMVVSEGDKEEVDDTLTIVTLCIMAGLLALAICGLVNLTGLLHFDLCVTALLALSSCIGGCAVVPRARLRKEIRFGPVLAAELLALIAGQVVTAISLAAAGWGAHALAVGACVQSLVICCVVRLQVSASALALPSAGSMAEMLRAGMTVGRNSAAEIANGQLPSLILGSQLGAAALGMYNRSYSLVQMPIQLLIASINRVMVSALYSVRDDQQQLRSASRTMIAATSVTITPVAAGLAGASGNFVLLALGRDWGEATAIMPILAFGAWAAMMGALFAIISEAKRAFAAKVRVQLSSSIALAILALGGTLGGLTGAVTGIALAACIFLLLSLRLAARQLHLQSLILLGWLAPGIIVGLPCLAIAVLLGQALDASAAAELAVQVAACGLIYLVVLMVFYPRIALQLAQTAAPGLLQTMPTIERYLRSAEEGRLS